MLSNTEQLLIRACRSNNPNKRLLSTYRRFYYYSEDENICKKNLVIILANLVDKLVGKIDITDVIEELSPNNIKYMLGEPYDYREAVILFLVDKIRFLEASKIEGLRTLECLEIK